MKLTLENVDKMLIFKYCLTFIWWLMPAENHFLNQKWILKKSNMFPFLSFSFENNVFLFGLYRVPDHVISSLAYIIVETVSLLLVGLLLSFPNNVTPRYIYDVFVVFTQLKVWFGVIAQLSISLYLLVPNVVVGGVVSMHTLLYYTIYGVTYFVFRSESKDIIQIVLITAIGRLINVHWNRIIEQNEDH